MIHFVEGSVFMADKAFSLGHCISGDTEVGMFRGIAVKFMELFPELEKLRFRGNREVGTVLPVKLENKFMDGNANNPIQPLLWTCISTWMEP